MSAPRVSGAGVCPCGAGPVEGCPVKCPDHPRLTFRPMPEPLYRLPLEGGGMLTVSPDLADPQGLMVAITVAPVAVAAPVSRDAIRLLVETLDDFLYDSRPR